MNDQQLQEAVSALPAPRVTAEYLTSRIASSDYLRHDTTTICVMTLDNGFKVIGHSTPASPENFRQEIGEAYAYRHAFEQLWRLFGFLLVETKRVSVWLVLGCALLSLSACVSSSTSCSKGPGAQCQVVVTATWEPACEGSCARSDVLHDYERWGAARER